jgi:hypothetical protein
MGMSKKKLVDKQEKEARKRESLGPEYYQELTIFRKKVNGLYDINNKLTRYDFYEVMGGDDLPF